MLSTVVWLKAHKVTLKLDVNIFQVPRVGNVQVVQAERVPKDKFPIDTKDGVEIEVKEVELEILNVGKDFTLGRLNDVSPFMFVGENDPTIKDDKSRLVSAFIVLLPKSPPAKRNFGRLIEVRLAYVAGAKPKPLPPR